jgi:hypothetical protein
VLFVLWATAVSAHSFEPALLDVREGDRGQFEAIWRLPGAESGALLPGDEQLRPSFPAHCRVRDAAPPPTVPDAPTRWHLACGAHGLRGEAIALPGIAGSRLEVVVRVLWADGHIDGGVIRSGAETYTVPAQPGATVRAGLAITTVLRTYLALGIEHILFGFDHLAFVLGLLLLVGSWRTLLLTITAFTVAHSLSLALAILGVVAVPPAPVEALIAGSIVLVAVELTRDAGAPPTLARRSPWLIALIFGLVHGLGFAGALSAIGLPPDQIPLALLAFNVGVEIGQVGFVLACIAPLLVWWRFVSAQSPWRLAPAYVIGSLAVAWMIERLQAIWSPPA